MKNMKETSQQSLPFLDSIDPDKTLVSEFLGTMYRSPLIVASGTLIENVEQIEPFLDSGAGAVIPRTTRLHQERTVHPSPHLYIDGARSNANMLNAEWTGSDISYWRPYLREMADNGQTIMAVSGRDIEGCVEVCKEIDDFDFPYIEINVGCGVTNGVIGYITRDEEHIKRLVGSIKEEGVKTPIAIKLGHSDYIVPLSAIAQEEGVDAIVAVNTFGPVFDFAIKKDGTARSVMGVDGGRGGLSGNSLFHTALTDVATISHELGIPVAASGGVNTAERAAKMLFAGAGIVQIYTYLHERGTEAPQAMQSFTKSFVNYMASHNIDNVESIKGKALKILDQKTELIPQIPVVDDEMCTGCDRCVPVCLPEAFTTKEAKNRNGHVVEVLGAACVGCGVCVSVCPVEGAIEMPATNL